MTELHRPSLIEVVIDEIKSAIDAGDVDLATARVMDLARWVPDPIGDMKVHIERWREQNFRSHAPSSVFEDAALAVLDWLDKDE